MEKYFSKRKEGKMKKIRSKKCEGGEKKRVAV